MKKVWALIADSLPRELGHGGDVYEVELHPRRGNMAPIIVHFDARGRSHTWDMRWLLGLYETEEDARATKRIVETVNTPQDWGHLKDYRQAYERQEGQMREREVSSFRLNALQEEEV